MKFHFSLSASLAAAIATLAPAAHALPGFLAGKGAVPTSDSTHVVILKKGDKSVVTMMTDYKGDLQPFVVVMPVPDDVVVEDMKTLRRDFVDHVDQISAPRFHEFWEMDPCEPGPPTQIWEQDMTARADTNFLGGAQMFGDDPKKKVPKELQLTVEPEYKEGEQTFTILKAGEGAEDVVGWLKQRGYNSPPGAKEAIDPYVRAGMQLLVTQVDEKKVELVSGNRAIVSPIRYATSKPIKVASTLGLLNLDKMQELFIYVIAPDSRYEVKNYKNVFPPTNIEVDFKVKERMGEFYAGLHDLMLKKDPQAFIAEYAWPLKGCGQPCATEPLAIWELLSIGADFFERDVPDEEKNPKPPDRTDEEKKEFDAIKDKEQKKRIEDDRKELERRKALLARHANYVLSRLHHRYDRKTLPHDVEIGPAPPVKGGVDIPKGPKHMLSPDVTPFQENKLQTRFTFFYPSKVVIHCDSPERGRWGKPPITYRGLRKIWVAQDIATKNRNTYKPALLVKTPIPALGLKGAAATPRDGGADGGKANAKTKGGKCGCTIGERARAADSLWLFAALAVARIRRRR